MSQIARYKQFSDEEFTNIVKNSRSMHDVMLALGYNASTGRSRVPVKERILSLGLEIPSMTGEELTANARAKTRLSNDEYFKLGVERKGTDICNRLIKEGLREYKCECCGNTGEWNGKILKLQVDHINGDHFDNRLENIRLLCPNCHSQTNTFCGKNIK